MIKKSILSAFMLAALFSCEKDGGEVEDPDHDDHEELITTVKVNFTPTGGGATSTFQFVDADGEGGNEPTVFDTLMLSTGITYDVTLEFWNESETPAENITEEVLEEADEHLICFETVSSELAVTRTDSDANSYEVGLESSWVAGAVSKGNITISLKHQGDEKDGTCAVGETDVEITFPFDIK